MPARLSSLLVRDGLVGVKRMEKAFQRQVIYGGSLDTILLEMSLVPEERLTQYLALASGLPPAGRDEGSNIQPTAVALVTSELATKFRAVPLNLEGEALRLLVCSPLEISGLEDLADLLDRPLQPLITTEYRWHLAYSSAYRIEAPARFTTLARSLAVDVVPAPVGRAASVIVDGGISAPIVAPPPQPTFGVRDDPTERFEFRPPSAVPETTKDAPTERVVVEMPLPTSERARTSTLVGVKPVRAEVGIGIPPRAPAASVTPSQPVAAAHPQISFRRANRVTGAPGTARAGIEPIATAGRDSPLAVVRARELLATADDRDSVFLTLLRAVRARVRYAGLLTVQGGAAIGRIALAEPGIDATTITSVLLPLDVPSVFRAVTQTQQPHVGPIVSGDPSIDAMLLRMGGAVPPSALLLPIVLRERVVAVVLAHRGHSDLKLVDVTELLPLAAGAADALGRLIVRHKSAGYRAPDPTAAAPKVELEEVDTKKVSREPSAWSAPSARQSVPIMPLDAPPPPRVRPVGELLDAIESAPENTAHDEIADAVERAPDVLAELATRFPGKLRIERFSVSGGRTLRASQYGGLLELCVRLGAAASEVLVDRLSSPQRDVRFYATVCAAEIRPRSAVFALVERVFDQDYGVRSMAIEALAGYPPADLAHAMPRARRALHSSDPETVAAATAALVQLGDVDAVDDLIGSVERGDRGAEHARRALVTLTAQDFGLSERKWRKWYETAKRRHRIEWLIEGLVHKEDGIREGAINDLRRLTGEYFGYHHDLPRKEREVAAERWASWWRETGQRRFTTTR